MDDDEDNDQRNEDDEDQEPSMRSYSKKKFFGKTTRDIKALNLRCDIKPKQQLLKPFKVTLEETIPKIWTPGQANNSIKIRHKDEFKTVTSKSKLNFSFKNHNQVQNYDVSNTLSTKVKESSLTLHTKYNSKSEAGAKISQSFKFWEGWKLKYGLEYELKKEGVFGANANIERKWVGPVPKWMSFASQYSDVLSLGVSGKSNLKRKLQAFYKGHLVTNENHKFYFEHKFGYDPCSSTPYSNTFTANCQDNLGIGTLNASVQRYVLLRTFQDQVIKTKEFRCVIEFEKSLAFGLQRRNQIFEVMMQKSKIKNSWVRLFRINAGNRGLFSSIEGKLKPFGTSLDYTLGYKLKGIQNNFYEDSSLGFTLKFNL